MAEERQAVWRMACCSGSGGEDHWERCFELGVAAIACDDLPDMSRVPEVQFPKRFRKYCDPPSPSLQGGFRNFIYHMNEGDTIYAKQGRELVKKGSILGPYQYRRGILKKRGYGWWAYYREVRWEEDFPSISSADVPQAFEAQQHTVLRLDGDRLAEVLTAEARARRKEVKREVEEGRRARREITLQLRNRKIIQEKKWLSGGKCEVCGLRMQDVYLNLSRDILVGHHISPLSKAKRPRKIALKDLAIVCPNCHQAMHTENPPLTVEQLQSKLGLPF